MNRMEGRGRVRGLEREGRGRGVSEGREGGGREDGIGLKEKVIG